ncbi:MAG TPA: class I SAM-dependent methyltransferase [Burkholderiaceae bacterium]|nr:class I SAM-dependent methyltransferase [Burkholderiaceae bacterium]
MSAVDPIVHLWEFLRQPAGRYLLAWEQRQYDAAVADIFGYHALQLGLPELDALRENRMPLRFCASDRLLPELNVMAGQTQVMVIAHFEELPFASQSIDLVVMPHVLEFADEPHQVLREVERVLVPEGQIVITGFNPASLWGARQYLARLGATPFLPRAGQFIGLPRLKDWLKLLSFEVNRGRFGCYVPSCRTEQWLARWSFMEKAGDRWWPVLGSVYMLTAVKRVRGMRLVGLARQRRPERKVALAPIASRTLAATGEAQSVIVADDTPAANEALRRGASG